MTRKLYTIVLFSFLFTFFGCGEKKNETNKSQAENNTIKDSRIQVTQAQFGQSKMTLGSLEEKSFPNVVSVNGMIDVPPENRAVVNATMGGYIKTTPLLIGDKVLKGQVLVTIENPEFVTIQQNYMEVNEQLTYLKAEYDRQVA
ncbi:efflux RND transporter periplasmic adaptor subunit [Algibacter lectus]|uniref:Probable Co/Zn/Cd efflux system membrane fusion protein n=1 Tax=Algibacter lectus TaxID=221126 RepID=A0A090VJZ2_9FLAO|nr:efflux RND transporter periplasmic adaptor subunit [Algibacter lectus]GAL63674.1 probable Co/Zn/Cd efflux system membrane fusion protein [Algibacter lectus]